MKLLNVGCGGHRPQQEHWWNLDTLRDFLQEGTPERTNLDAEPRYIDCNLLHQSIPYRDEFFDGILIQHVLEHFTCHETTIVLGACRRVLRPGGLLVASVPDVGYFLSVYEQDKRERSVELFGESISGDWQDAQCEKFFDYALFHREHKQVLNMEGLCALLLRSGFDRASVTPFDPPLENQVASEIRQQLNRLKFSAILYAYK